MSQKQTYPNIDMIRDLHCRYAIVMERWQDITYSM